MKISALSHTDQAEPADLSMKPPLGNLEEVQVAVNSPVKQAYTYLAPRGLVLGTRILVPFRSQELSGVILGPSEASGRSKYALKSITKVLDSETNYLTSDLIRLGKWLAHYYEASLGEALATVAPPSLLFKKRKKSAAGEPEASEHLSVAPPLTDEQESAVYRICESFSADRADIFLLKGVTGSGKTEVFLASIARLFSFDKEAQALILVPEISLTPQALKVFNRRFGSLVAIVHSGMTSSQRTAALLRIREGKARVLIGPRSAVFGPFPKLKLIIVDEEHDGSYKQHSGICYNGRDVAVARGYLENIPVVLASATPSLETYTHALQGTYKLLQLTKRISSHGLPATEVIEASEQFYKPIGIASSQFKIETHLEELGDSIIPKEIENALRRTMAAGEQAIVLVNRRGFSYFLYDTEKQSPVVCPQCSVTWTVHQATKSLCCHYCGKTAYLKDFFLSKPEQYFLAFGSGSQKVEGHLKLLFPEVAIERVDSDSIDSAKKLSEIIEDFRSGKTQLLVGTQMLAKGHDFPNVTLVVLLELDQTLSLPDFRAAERTFQLIVQASGRAGRAEKPGRVILQTRRKDHPVIKSALAQNFEEFAERELAFRKAHGFPPFTKCLLIEFSSASDSSIRSLTEGVSLHLDNSYREGQEWLRGVRILGPVPAPIEKINTRIRRQIFIFSDNKEKMLAASARVSKMISPTPKDFRLKIDRDPYHLQ